MKVIVTHDSKQHVNRLIVCLENKGWLYRFYVGFASNKLPRLLRRFDLLEHWLRKRDFIGLNNRRISSFYLSTSLNLFIKNPYWQTLISSRLFDLWTAQKIMRKPYFDIIIGYENSNLLTFKIAKKNKKITVLDLAHVHHDMSLNIRKKFLPLSINVSEILRINKNKQCALQLTDYIFTLSSLATASLQKEGISQSRIYELNLGVDITLFHPSRKKRNQFTLLYVGAMNRLKGIENLILSFHSLGIPNASLLLIGPLGDMVDLQVMCTGAVKYIPFLHHDELVNYYQQADVFVFPSYLDSWGQVVLEAMACGTPVIVSDNTGAKDAVMKGGGFIIPTGDETALREKILYFYERRDEVNRLGEQARQIAEQYTWDNYYKQVISALTDIARREDILLH